MSRGYRGPQSTLTQVGSHWNKCCGEAEVKLWTFSSWMLFFFLHVFPSMWFIVTCLSPLIQLLPCFCRSNPVLQAYVNLHINADVATCTVQYVYKPHTLRVEIDFALKMHEVYVDCTVIEIDTEMSSFTFTAILSATRHEIYQENEGRLPIQSGSQATITIRSYVSILN